MISQVLDNFQPLQKYLISGVYNNDIHKKISLCNHIDIYNYMLFINMTQELFLNVDEYINGKKCKCDIDNHNISIIINDDNMYLYMYNIISLNNLINQDTNIICKPIYLNNNNDLHLMMLIIDRNNSNVMIFDSTTNNNIINRIEKTLNSIIQEYNIVYNTNFQILPYDIWNINKISLNRSFSISSIYFGGFCVILSLLFSHYMMLTNNNIEDSLELFSNLSHDQLLSIINDYSLFYYYFLII